MASLDELRQVAARAVVAKALFDELAAVASAARDVIESELNPGNHIDAVLPDGTPIGEVMRSKLAKRAVVTDAAALLAWVKSNRPDEVEVVESVRSSFVNALLADAKARGSFAVDATTGQVIPGIEVVAGSSSYRPVVSDEGREVVAARLGTLMRTQLALPEGG